MARKSRKTTGVTVDLSGVETGGKTLPEGQYLVNVAETTLEESRNSGANYIKFVFEVTEGKNKGSKLFHNCSLQPQALFNLKSVLAALGFNIPSKAFDLDINELVGLECLVEVTHEMYEGKKKARITDFINPEESDEAEGDDEEAGELEELLEDLTLDQLKELAAEVGIKKAALKKVKDEDDIIDLLLEEDEDEVEAAYDELFGDEEEADSEDEEEEADYESMTLAELKKECKERGLKVKKGMDKDDLVEMLEEDDDEEL